MQSDTWKTLLEKVPADYHHNLLVVTSVGLEVSVQTILRKEDEYLVVRGRLAGTTDTGRLFFIPYDQINLVCIQKPMRAAEVSAMFGEPVDTAEADTEETSLGEANATTAAEAEDVEKTQPIAQPPVVEEPPKPATPPRLSKSELLARIRSRSLGTNGPSADQ
jgi:hypothetical protein